MKLRLQTLVFIVFILSTLHSFAVNTKREGHPNTQPQKLTDISIGQFIAMDFDQLQESKLIKINWLQKSIFKAAQKKLTKKVAKGKIEADSFVIKARETKNENSRGKLALIFGVSGLLLLTLGTAGLILAFPLGILAFILGIIGLRKDKNRTMATLGVVLGSLLLLPGIAILLFFIAHSSQM